MDKTVAIQGVQGSFHHIVSQNYFADTIGVLPCSTFDAVVDNLKNGLADIGIMALENSIAGSIIPNYALIDGNELNIVGEYFLDVQQHLMVLNGQCIDDIMEVHSHPMALLQCKEFFKKYPHIKLIEDKDTAEVAQRIHQKQIKGIGAIASSLAATIYDLQILASNIQTIKHNETRFVVVQTKDSLPNAIKNKASLKFSLNHKRGSLAAMLNVMSDCKLNLTKIQSLPVIQTPWKYAFFVDVTFESLEHYLKAKSIMDIMAEEFKVLGVYKNAKL
jgi:prephenate dehydratase